jgi:hypothetical protein
LEQIQRAGGFSIENAGGVLRRARQMPLKGWGLAPINNCRRSPDSSAYRFRDRWKTGVHVTEHSNGDFAFEMKVVWLEVANRCQRFEVADPY